MFVSFFRTSAIFALFVTATAKLVSAVGKPGILATEDPILHLQIRYVLIGVGMLELGVVWLLCSYKHRWFSCLMTAMMGAQFIFYHKVFALSGSSRGCPCLGTMAEWLPISQTTTNLLLMIIANWLCLGGAIACHLSYPYCAERGR
jgi:hypothetical protein